ncbi:MAG: chlorophyll synthesis pathway protein BchC [Rhizobiales bacterium]|nr:chlorophyll synthesis pathway protein BchC [Hyphomicrobiales bacterium]
MTTTAIVVEEPHRLVLRGVGIIEPGPTDVEVEVEHTSISAGTERLLWSGQMPAFPGMGYPLVPGYETVGRIVRPDHLGLLGVGARVFVPGSSCFRDVRGLFGGAASRLVVPSHRVLPLAIDDPEQGVLLALAATALRAVKGAALPELIVGHGVLGRLIARMVLALGGVAPTVWENNAERCAGAIGYRVCAPDEDERRDYRNVCDVSGDPAIVDELIARLAPAGEITLAGFYPGDIRMSFAPAFMKEARLRISAEWKPDDLAAVARLTADGRLSLDGLITHRLPASQAPQAYCTAFEDPSCLKMVLDWRTLH